MSAHKFTNRRTTAAKKYYQKILEQATEDPSLAIQSGIQRWDFRLTDELFRVREDMTLGEFKGHILNLVETEKTPGTN